MNLNIIRKSFTSQSTIGLLVADGGFQCFTLEPPWKTDDTKPRAIPFGTFELTIRWSVEHQRHLPHVENVPGFVAIELHIGNFPKDTKGCTLVGETSGPEPNFIGGSLKAFTALLSLLLENAVLSNPNSPEKEHVWKVGHITYSDGRLAQG